MQFIPMLEDVNTHWKISRLNSMSCIFIFFDFLGKKYCYVLRLHSEYKIEFYNKQMHLKKSVPSAAVVLDGHYVQTV